MSSAWHALMNLLSLLPGDITCLDIFSYVLWKNDKLWWGHEKWKTKSSMTHPSYGSVHLGPLITWPCALMQANRDFIFRGAKECHAQVEAIMQHHVEHYDDHGPVKVPSWGGKSALLVYDRTHYMNEGLGHMVNCFNCFKVGYKHASIHQLS